MNDQIPDATMSTLANAIVPMVYLSVAAATACNDSVSVYEDGCLVPMELTADVSPNQATLGGVQIEVISPQSAEMFSRIALAVEGDNFV